MSTDCVLGARHEEQIAALKAEAVRLAGVDQEQWQAINQIKNRLPTWATVVISLLTFLCGILASAAAR